MLHSVIVGCGFIARTHAQVLKEMNVKTDLVIGADLKETEAFAAEFGIPRASDSFSDLYEVRPDCVHICTPPALHFRQVKELLTAGIAVFCEKPLCLSEAEAAELVRTAEENHVLNAMDFNVRYHKGVQEIRKKLMSGEAGKLYLTHGTYLQEFHIMPCPMGWRYISGLAGKMRAVTEIGSHWLDLFEYITGAKICSVNAVFTSPVPERTVKDGMIMKACEGDETFIVDTEDAALIHFRTEDGMIGSVVLSEISAGRVNYLSMEFCGEKQNIRWDSEAPNTVYTGIQNRGTTAVTYPFDGGFADTQRKLFRAFYEDLASGGKKEEKDYPTLRDGLRNIRLCEAVYRSAEKGRWENTDE